MQNNIGQNYQDELLLNSLLNGSLDGLGAIQDPTFAKQAVVDPAAFAFQPMQPMFNNETGVSSPEQGSPRVNAAVVPSRMSPLADIPTPPAPVEVKFQTAFDMELPPAPDSPPQDTTGMTQEQIKTMRRERRLRKNRESAQASRQRKRAYVDSLERQVAALTEEKNGLQVTLEALVSKNSTLAQEVEHLRNVIRQSNALTSYYALST